MIAVIFEVVPHPELRQTYLDIAAGLRPVLERIDGFISVERFESLTQPGKLLSLSFWRQVEKHRSAQKAGRERVFQGYRLRVAAVVRDYGLEERDEAPPDSIALHG